MNSPVLDIKNLQVSFPGLVRKTNILRSVDLTVNEGDVMGLVGESGSGKSMTALAALGMVPAPGLATGSVKVAGHEMLGRSETELASLRGGNAAMIFQNPTRALSPFFTIGQQMTEIIGFHLHCGKRDARAVAIENLNAVHVPDPDNTLEKYPHQISGGQIQRVMIALAIACKPKLLIADEPTTALDVTIQAQIISLLRELSDKTGLTVLFITHDLGVVSLLCNKVAVMYAGQIVERGSVEDVVDHPGHPYTRKLMNTVPTVGRGSNELDSIPGQVPHPAFLPSGCTFHDRCDFASTVCAQRAPEVIAVSDGHMVACHHTDKTRISEGEPA